MNPNNTTTDKKNTYVPTDRPTNVLDRKTSLFKNVFNNDNPTYLTIGDFLHCVQNGKWKSEIEQARQLSFNDKQEYVKYKQTLPLVTLSAYCKNRKSTGNDAEKLIYHTGLLQIDIDNLPSGVALSEVKALLCKDQYTVFCCISPSGCGLKIGINIDGDRHSESFKQAENYYKSTYNVEIDKAVKDLYRPMFVSYDPELYVNEQAETFTVNEGGESDEVSAKLHNPEIYTNGSNHSNTNQTDKIKSNAILNIKAFISKADKAKRDRHLTRCKAGFLAGGYVSGGVLAENEIMPLIIDESNRIADNGKTTDNELKTLQQAFNEGKSKPITLEMKVKEYNTWISKHYNTTTPDASKNVQIIDKSTGEITEVELPFIFWYEQKEELKINHSQLFDFLISQGFKRLSLDKNDVKKDILVKINDNKVFEIDIKYIRSFVTDKIKSLPDKISDKFTKEQLREVFLKGLSQYISIEKISEFKQEHIEFMKDTKDKSCLFFKNGFVEITKDAIQIKHYKELDGYIWKSQIIDKHINIIPDERLPEQLDNFDFVKFTRNICSTKSLDKQTDILDQERYKSLCCVFGYLLHNYKTTANLLAIVLTESNVDVDDSKGGTGKGLLMQALGYCREKATIDGKNFSFDSQFAFQNVNLDTQILYIDDINRYFHFERLYSAITEGLSFERKHKDRIKFTPEDSPKIVLSTNYAITDNSPSALRRKFEMELLCYYSDKHRPIDDFGKEFFYTWSNSEWNLFYNFMFNCIQIYMQNNNTIPAYSSATIDAKKLVNKTSREFVEYADTLKRNDNLHQIDTYNNFLEFAGLDKKEYSSNKFTRNLQHYCNYKSIGYQMNVITIHGKATKFYFLEENN